jgi:hypothetical protein
VANNKAELEGLEVETTEMRKGFDDLAQFFGEDVTIDVPLIVFDFVNQFNVFCYSLYNY